MRELGKILTEAQRLIWLSKPIRSSLGLQIIINVIFIFLWPTLIPMSPSKTSFLRLLIISNVVDVIITTVFFYL